MGVELSFFDISIVSTSRRDEARIQDAIVKANLLSVLRGTRVLISPTRYVLEAPPGVPYPVGGTIVDVPNGPRFIILGKNPPRRLFYHEVAHLAFGASTEKEADDIANELETKARRL